jgi:predicted nucleic acid-binding protein
MTSSTIDQLPTGHRVFVDSTIFVYHFTGASPACRAFLERCERLELDAFTLVIVLAEVTHRLMMIEAVASGMITPGNVAKKLREKPEAVKKLRLHAEHDRMLLAAARSSIRAMFSAARDDLSAPK